MLADPHTIWPEFMAKLPQGMGVTVIRNKADLSGDVVGMEQEQQYPVISLSAKNADGIELVREHLKACIGFQGATEGGFMARRRHLDALEHAAYQLEMHVAGEILAEELRLTQQYLNEITGEFTSDDLLGKIFSSFCIGK
ncbi:GTPase [Pseudoalteromonas carrageenovora]|uniref:GTPase n=1 Tax=Pseudoalteromonas carrageenovora IAM 12662 TaxID=1314868 RepID=A0A2K4XDS3_PSEVC